MPLCFLCQRKVTAAERRARGPIRHPRRLQPQERCLHRCRELTGPGMDGTIGAWAVSKSMLRTGGGLAFALDAITREFSDLGAAANEGSPARAYTDELEATEAYERAVSCAEG